MMGTLIAKGLMKLAVLFDKYPMFKVPRICLRKILLSIPTAQITLIKIFLSQILWIILEIVTFICTSLRTVILNSFRIS